MKKISILGLIASLFVVFAFSSCGKDNEPKKEIKKDEKASFVGKTYKVLTTWEEEVVEDESKMKDDDTRRYYIFIFDSKEQLTFKHGTYTPSDKTDKTGEFNGNEEDKYNYTYDEATRTIKLTKVLSVKTDIENNGQDPLEQERKFAESFKKRVNLKFDEKFEVLSLVVIDEEGKTHTLPFKLQK